MSADSLTPQNTEPSPPEAGAPAEVVRATAVDEFVDAELVAPPPGPFAFGMRAMFAIMAMAAVQFALMNYLGMLLGLLLGILVCVLVTAVLIFAAAVMQAKPGSATMEHLDRLAIRLVFGIVLLFFGTLLAGGGQIVYNVLEDHRIAWQVQSDLGFTYDETNVWRSNYTRSEAGLIVSTVRSGGPLDQAGVKPGEVLVVEDSAHKFVRTVAGLRGKSIEVLVVSGTSGAIVVPIDTLPQRNVTVQIPP